MAGSFPCSAGVEAVFPGEHRPDWGTMSFLAGILRPTAGEGPSWYHLLKKASGGCNDLLYSGHMLVAVLTAMAWQVCPHSSLSLPNLWSVIATIDLT